MTTQTTAYADVDRARGALHAIPPDIGREDWVKIGMAAKAAGLDFNDFDQWSAKGAKYKQADARDTWNSLKANGGIGAGTLYDMAAKSGWQDGEKASRKPETPRKTDSHCRAQGHDVAALWARCESLQSHPYIDAKQGQPDGLRIVPESEPLTIAGYAVAGWLVVPALANPANPANQDPQSLQFIPPPGIGRKLNMPGASMTGASFTVGEINDTAYVVEGIGQAWACHKATGQAAVVAFGWGNVGRIAAGLDSDMVLVPDKGKEADAEHLAAELGAAVAFMPDNEADNFDANDYAQREGHEALADLLGQAVKVSKDSQLSQAPEPLRRPTPPPEPYPMQELGEVLGPAAQSLRRVIQAPDAICGASILAAASLATQGLANVIRDGQEIPLSLWCLSVAESGERKSAVDKEAMRPIRDHEKCLMETHASAKQSHDNKMEEWKVRRDKAKEKAKKQGGAGLAEALSDIGEAPPAPLLPYLTVGDFTAEGLFKAMRDGMPSMGAFTDEAALVFGGHGMTKETVTRTAGALSKLWDNGTLDRIRSGGGSTRLCGRRLALHLMAQPVIAERALSDDVLAGQGFLARCLLAWPESTAGNRPYKADNLREDEALNQYRARLGDLLRHDLPLVEGTENELAPRKLTLSAKSFEAWRDVHDAIEREIAPNGKYAIARPWASKAAEQCLRIAGVLALVDNPEAQRIEADTIERAAEIALWHLNEAVRLSGTAEISSEVRNAEALLKWCHETGREVLHSGAALRLGPNRIRERKRFSEAVGELEKAGWAYPVQGGAKVDGKHRRNVWRVLPESESA